MSKAKKNPQSPLGSGFGHGTSWREVIKGVNLAGKTAFVTGGYSGIGTETVKALSAAGAHVIVGARRPEAARQALSDIPGRFTIVRLELSDPASIDACAIDVMRETRSLELLINNAAIMACPLERIGKGYESQFATNHLGHFRLTGKLWPLLKAASDGARVICLSSLAHKRSRFVEEDPHYTKRPYEKWEAYGQSKTANALFALELDRRSATFGVRAFSVHPGGIQTNLGRYLDKEDIAMLMARAEGAAVGGAPAIVWKNAEQGAATSIWAATSPLLAGKGGVYCEDCDVAALLDEGDETTPNGVKPHAGDKKVARRLWRMSEKMTGFKFDVE